MSDTTDPLDSFEERDEAKARRGQQAELALYNAVEDLKWLMGNLRGRRIMWGLLERTGVRREPMTGNSQTFYNLGMARIGRDYEAEIFAVCPEQYTLMITENSK